MNEKNSQAPTNTQPHNSLSANPEQSNGARTCAPNANLWVAPNFSVVSTLVNKTRSQQQKLVASRAANCSCGYDAACEHCHPAVPTEDNDLDAPDGPCLSARAEVEDKRLSAWIRTLKERQRIAQHIAVRTGKKPCQLLFNRPSVDERDKMVIQRLMEQVDLLSRVDCSNHTDIPCGRELEVSGMPRLTRHEVYGSDCCCVGSRWIDSKMVHQSIVARKDDFHRLVNVFPEIEHLHIVGTKMVLHERNEADANCCPEGTGEDEDERGERSGMPNVCCCATQQCEQSEDAAEMCRIATEMENKDGDGANDNDNDSTVDDDDTDSVNNDGTQRRSTFVKTRNSTKRLSERMSMGLSEDNECDDCSSMEDEDNNNNEQSECTCENLCDDCNCGNVENYPDIDISRTSIRKGSTLKIPKRKSRRSSQYSKIEGSKIRKSKTHQNTKGSPVNAISQKCCVENREAAMKKGSFFTVVTGSSGINQHRNKGDKDIRAQPSITANRSCSKIDTKSSRMKIEQNASRSSFVTGVDCCSKDKGAEPTITATGNCTNDSCAMVDTKSSRMNIGQIACGRSSVMRFDSDNKDTRTQPSTTANGKCTSDGCQMVNTKSSQMNMGKIPCCRSSVTGFDCGNKDIKPQPSTTGNASCAKIDTKSSRMSKGGRASRGSSVAGFDRGNKNKRAQSFITTNGSCVNDSCARVGTKSSRINMGQISCCCNSDDGLDDDIMDEGAQPSINAKGNCTSDGCANNNTKSSQMNMGKIPCCRSSVTGFDSGNKDIKAQPFTTGNASCAKIDTKSSRMSKGGRASRGSSVAGFDRGNKNQRPESFINTNGSCVNDSCAGIGTKSSRINMGQISCCGNSDDGLDDDSMDEGAQPSINAKGNCTSDGCAKVNTKSSQMNMGKIPCCRSSVTGFDRGNKNKRAQSFITTSGSCVNDSCARVGSKSSRINIKQIPCCGSSDDALDDDKKDEGAQPFINANGNCGRVGTKSCRISKVLRPSRGSSVAGVDRDNKDKRTQSFITTNSSNAKDDTKSSRMSRVQIASQNTESNVAGFDGANIDKRAQSSISANAYCTKADSKKIPLASKCVPESCGSVSTENISIGNKCPANAVRCEDDKKEQSLPQVRGCKSEALCARDDQQLMVQQCNESESNESEEECSQMRRSINAKCNNQNQKSGNEKVVQSKDCDESNEVNKVNGRGRQQDFRYPTINNTCTIPDHLSIGVNLRMVDMCVDNDYQRSNKFNTNFGTLPLPESQEQSCCEKSSESGCEIEDTIFQPYFNYSYTSNTFSAAAATDSGEDANALCDRTDATLEPHRQQNCELQYLHQQQYQRELQQCCQPEEQQQQLLLQQQQRQQNQQQQQSLQQQQQQPQRIGQNAFNPPQQKRRATNTNNIDNKGNQYNNNCTCGKENRPLPPPP